MEITLLMQKVLYCKNVYRNCTKMTKSKKCVQNASNIRLQNGTKNNDTSSNMLLNYCYTFGLSLYSLPI